jgi:hypothetical protein
LGAMLRQLEDQEAGRPALTVSPEETALKAKVAELEQKLAVAEQTAEIRAVLRAMDLASAKKKGGPNPPTAPHDRTAPAAVRPERPRNQ